MQYAIVTHVHECRNMDLLNCLLLFFYLITRYELTVSADTVVQLYLNDLCSLIYAQDVSIPDFSVS
jgi:hypothetical protein